jgi:hypothetical protein
MASLMQTEPECRYCFRVIAGGRPHWDCVRAGSVSHDATDLLTEREEQAAPRRCSNGSSGTHKTRWLRMAMLAEQESVFTHFHSSP